MTIDEQLMFHLTQGALRRWSLWNESTGFPAQLADPAEYDKWALFQSWKAEPYKVVGNDQHGQPQYKFHPMSEFENWSLWLILDLLRTLQMPQDTYMLFSEPENLKLAIVNMCEDRFSNFEKQSPSHLFS